MSVPVSVTALYPKDPNNHQNQHRFEHQRDAQCTLEELRIHQEKVGKLYQPQAPLRSMLYKED